ncbi:MAG: SEL1-like repeat protein [Bacteroidales bacterium]|nr:SEL1-like repeat protein [Bacteroidales bacterium]
MENNKNNAEYLNDKGMRYEEAGNYAKALELYGEAAKQNFSFAKYNLGRCYYYGLGVAQDYCAAVNFFKESEDFAPSLYLLANCYIDGTGVESDVVQAIELCQKSAEMHYDVAQSALGYCYFTGYCVPQNFTKAAEWFEKAANNGNAQAMLYLSDCYGDGKGVKQNSEKAFQLLYSAAGLGYDEAEYRMGLVYLDNANKGKTDCYRDAADWFSKAAGKGYALAQYEYANLLYDGKGVKQNYAQAAALYEAAAEQDVVYAQVMLGYMYLCGLGVAEDHKKSVNYFIKAATSGEAIAQWELGKAYETGDGIDQNSSIAMEWYTKAAEQGEPLAQNSIGKYHYNIAENLNGDNPDNYAIAVEWFKKAANQNLAEAQYYLGKCYLNGKGVEKNIERAIKYYNAAAMQDYTEAQIEILRFRDDSNLKDRISTAEYDNLVNKLAQKGALSAYCDREKKRISSILNKEKQNTQKQIEVFKSKNAITVPQPWNYAFPLIIGLNVLMFFLVSKLWLLLSVPLTILYFLYVVRNGKITAHIDSIDDCVSPNALEAFKVLFFDNQKRIIKFKIYNSILLILTFLTILLPLPAWIVLIPFVTLIVFNASKSDNMDCAPISMYDKGYYNVVNNDYAYQSGEYGTISIEGCGDITLLFNYQSILNNPIFANRLQDFDKEYEYYKDLAWEANRLYQLEQYESKVKHGEYVSFRTPESVYVNSHFNSKRGYVNGSANNYHLSGNYPSRNFQQTSYQHNDNYFQQEKNAKRNGLSNEFKEALFDTVSEEVEGLVDDYLESLPQNNNLNNKKEYPQSGSHSNDYDNHSSESYNSGNYGGSSYEYGDNSYDYGDED